MEIQIRAKRHFQGPVLPWRRATVVLETMQFIWTGEQEKKG